MKTTLFQETKDSYFNRGFFFLAYIFTCVTLGNFIFLFLSKCFENFLKKLRFLQNDSITLTWKLLISS